MKKLFLGLAFASILAFAFPTEVKAETPCSTVTVQCCNGQSFMAIVCKPEDLTTWLCIYCDHCEND